MRDGALREQRLGEDQDIFLPLTQWRQGQHHHRQAVIQVGPKLTGAELLTQVGIGRGDEFHIHGPLGECPQAAHLLALDGGQQLALQRQGHGVDLVQKQGATDGSLEQPGLGTFGIGKCPCLKTKQFGFEHGLGQGRAVDFQEWPAGTWATVVYDTCHQALAGAGLALEQQRGHRRVAWRIKAHELLNLCPQSYDSLARCPAGE